MAALPLPAASPEGVPTIKAYKSTDFLTSASARSIRILCELQEPGQRLAKQGIDNLFLVTGSHLAMHPDTRQSQIVDLEKKIAKGGPRDEMEALHARLRLAKRLQGLDRYYLVAAELTEKIARWNLERKSKGSATYHVCTGGGPGIMEAANRGAKDGGDLSLGFGATRPEWGALNQYVDPEGAFEFHYAFMRKYWMAYKCMGLIIFPGGLGCLDELFELLMLVSSRKIKHRLPIVLVGKEHWNKAINWDYLVESGMVSQSALDIIQFKDTADEVMQHIKEQVTLNDTEEGERTMVEPAAKKLRI